MDQSYVKVGEVVWAKYGSWPWWPSLVALSDQVIQIDVGEKKPIIVRFLGSSKNSDL